MTHDTAGLEVVSIPTNGSRPETTVAMTGEILRRCSGVGVRFALSMDGIGDEHDHIRGVRGTFECAIQNSMVYSPRAYAHPHGLVVNRERPIPTAPAPTRTLVKVLR